jgi:hypothetical protein
MKANFTGARVGSGLFPRERIGQLVGCHRLLGGCDLRGWGSLRHFRVSNVHGLLWR